MSRQCSTRGSDQEWMGYTLLLEKLFGRERLAYPATYCKRCGLYSSGTGQGPVAGFYEHGRKPGSRKKSLSIAFSTTNQ
jgi:hypothetical protein